MKYSPFLSCRQASRLITAQFDRSLGPLERVGLELHLKICSVCPIVVRQLDLLRVSMQEWRDTTEQ